MRTGLRVGILLTRRIRLGCVLTKMILRAHQGRKSDLRLMPGGSAITAAGEFGNWLAEKLSSLGKEAVTKGGVALGTGGGNSVSGIMPPAFVVEAIPGSLYVSQITIRI